MRKSKPYKLPLTISVDISSYIVFSIMFGGLSVFSLLILFVQQNLSFLPPSIIFLSIWFFSLIWLSSFKIILDQDGLSYRTLFSKKNARFSDISKVSIKIGPARGKEGKGFYRLEISSRRRGGSPIINMKPFSKTDLSILADALISNTSNVKFDDFTKSLQKGDLTPIIHTGIKSLVWVFFMVFIIFFVLTISRLLF